MKPRRGTKGNPFAVGDKVRLRDVPWGPLRSKVGEVVEVDAPEQNSPESGERSYAPIRYRVVWSTGESSWMPPRYIESF